LEQGRSMILALRLLSFNFNGFVDAALEMFYAVSLQAGVQICGIHYELLTNFFLETSYHFRRHPRKATKLAAPGE